MNPVHGDLRLIAEAAEVVSPTRLLVLGAPRDVPGPRPSLEEALATELYDRLYLCPRSADETARGDDDLGRRDLIAGLSAANVGSGTWEPGWTLVEAEAAAEDGRLAVRRDGLTFWADPADVRPEAVPACRVRTAKELRFWSPGYYTALGDADDDPDDPTGDGRLVRYYWHLTPAAAVPLVRAATTLLNGDGLPFRLKVLDDPAGFRRADAAVLFVRRRDAGVVAEAVGRIHETVAGGLRPEVPLFTHRLADGLSSAEDPDGDLSFGQDRCLLAARGLVRAFVQDGGGSTAEGRLRAIVQAFLEAGLDPARPDLAARP